MSEPRILLSAGEASGDLHGAELARALRRLYPNAQLSGLAGPRMVEAGVRPLVDFDRLAVMGMAELLTRLPFFYGLRRRIERLLDSDRPQLVIPIDYPGFNLRLCKAAHARGIPALYYVAPQVWAWRPERANILAETTARVAVVFPQEEPFLRKYGVRAVFVGHPLLDTLDEREGREEAIRALGTDPGRPILGLLPGSRPQEVRRHLRPFLAVAEEVMRRLPQVQVVVSSAPQVSQDHYAAASGFPLTSSSARLLSAATAVLSKSGTTTVEAALMETPLIIAHRVHPLTFAMARRLVTVESVGMVNLLAGRRIVPEFVQRLPRRAIADALLPLLEPRSAEREALIADLRQVRASLGEPGAAARVAALAQEVLDARA